LIGRLTLLGRHQIHALRLLVQRLGELTVDLKLGGDVRRQVFTVFRQQFGALQRLFRLTLALAVELIAQRLQIGIQLLALLLRQLGTGRDSSWRLLAESWARSSSSTSAFRRADSACRARFCAWASGIVAGLRADAALNLIELATGIGLLLRQLVQESAISRARSCSCCAWRLDSSSWLLTCRISWFSASAVRPVGTWRGSSLRLLSCAQALKQFGEIIDNVLILTGALEG
jgi:hypothetical protein